MSERGALFVAALLALTSVGAALAQSVHAPVMGAGNPVASVPLAALKATRERPLFFMSRRAPSVAAVAAPVQQPTEIVAVVDKQEAPPFTLVGTIIGPKDRIAIFMNDGARDATRLHEGDSASGWTLLSVDRRAVVLGNNGRSVALDLPKTATAASAPTGDVNPADAMGDGTTETALQQVPAAPLNVAAKVVKARGVTR